VAFVAFAGQASAADVAATDDTGKHLGAAAGPYYANLRAEGIRVNVVTLTFDPAQPRVPAEVQSLDKAMPVAARYGVRISIRLYPANPTAIGSSATAAGAFAAWAAQVARRYPTVTSFVVGNEPNQPRFWRPQFTAQGRQASASAFGVLLASTYDALKAVNPRIQVAGVGLSSRGNDRPGARDNVSTSPVRFLAALGAWYRKSGRTRPLMDAFSFHPYPAASIDPLEKKYEWPNAGFANLGRVKQALWDAFRGTAQPTTLNGLPLMLNEVGWEVDTTNGVGYTGTERVRVTSEAAQAAIYGKIVRVAACDPMVARVGFFAIVDEVDRGRMQTGLYRADGSARPSLATVSQAIAKGAAGCRSRPWRPARGVVGARVYFENWRRHCFGAQAAYRLCLTAGEDARYAVGSFPLGTSRRAVAATLARGGPGVTRGLVPANAVPPVRLAKRPGTFVAVRLVSAVSPARTSLFLSAR
jgi:hypothetical protein